MKKMGMIGGLGPESTVDYYREIMGLHRKLTGKDIQPEIIIDSVDMSTLIRLLENMDYEGTTKFLMKSLNTLKLAGADYAFIASNTPHVVFDKLKEISPLPLISIVEVAANRAEELNLKKVALLGTKFTMGGKFYEKEFEHCSINLVTPKKDEQALIHRIIMEELNLGCFRDESKATLLKIIKRMFVEEAIDGVILGCTELPLILNKDEFGIPFLNTTYIHVEAIIDYLLNN
ncbi:MAG TPA: amino acid racemase [Clostridiaceae bacterium]